MALNPSQLATQVRAHFEGIGKGSGGLINNPDNPHHHQHPGNSLGRLIATINQYRLRKATGREPKIHPAASTQARNGVDPAPVRPSEGRVQKVNATVRDFEKRHCVPARPIGSPPFEASGGKAGLILLSGGENSGPAASFVPGNGPGEEDRLSWCCGWVDCNAVDMLVKCLHEVPGGGHHALFDGTYKSPLHPYSDSGAKAQAIRLKIGVSLYPSHVRHFPGRFSPF